MHFRLSRRLNHEQMVGDLTRIPAMINNLNEHSAAFLRGVDEALQAFTKVYVYQFADGDVFCLVMIDNDTQIKTLRSIYQTLAAPLPDPSLHEMGAVDQEYQKIWKVADAKLLSSKRMDAYRAMADKHRTGSITARRNRRDEAIVLVVEDDRFTAAYANNILNKVYDIVHVRTGEDAILQYIAYAPDIIMIDIHLAGLNGTHVLQAITRIDPQAYAVMLSVDASHENVKQATQYGAQTFLKKPFSHERLIGTVRKSPHIRIRENRTLETVKV